MTFERCPPGAHPKQMVKLGRDLTRPGPSKGSVLEGKWDPYISGKSLVNVKYYKLARINDGLFYEGIWISLSKGLVLQKHSLANGRERFGAGGVLNPEPK